MIYNNLINHLKLWCINKSKKYQLENTEHSGAFYVGCQAADELEFNLSTLMDRPFGSINELREEVLNLTYVHYDPCILNPQNNTAKHIIDKTNQEFCDFLEEVILQNKNLPLADIPYKRVIAGSEADKLKEKFSLHWKYDNTSYWFPLMGDEPKEISDKFFVMFDFFEPYIKQFEKIIGLPQAHIYSFGANTFRPEHCIETTEIIDCSGSETIYTDKDFSWAIYFSHENTVSFAGSIVPKVKELLSAEKPHWDKFEPAPEEE